MNALTMKSCFRILMHEGENTKKVLQSMKTKTVFKKMKIRNRIPDQE